MADVKTWAEIPFILKQGSHWRRFIRFYQDADQTTGVDFTGFAADMHIREGVADADAPVLAHLSSRTGSDETQRIFFIGVDSAGDPVPEVEDFTSGMVMLELSAEDSRQILPEKVARKGLAEATLVYDLEFTAPGGQPDTWASDEIEFHFEVTRR
jgi:hypothetical protein